MESRDVALDDRIRSRAYEIYETRTQRGGSGDCVTDWLEAERDVRANRPGGGDMAALAETPRSGQPGEWSNPPTAQTRPRNRAPIS